MEHNLYVMAGRRMMSENSYVYNSVKGNWSFFKALDSR